MGSEFASDGGESDCLFGSSSLCCLGLVLAPGLLGQQSAENFRFQLAGIFTGPVGSERDRRGGISMQLKLFVLSGSALILWLTPLTVLDKRIGWHKSMQGLTLCAAIACAVTAGNIARKQAEQNEIEEIKTRAITADVVDEIATSAYISQQQRQQEAEQILNPREHLERSLALTYDGEEESEPIAQNQLAQAEQNAELERAERALQLKAKGWGKAKIILEVWGVSKGGSPKYKAAEAEYKRLVEG
jgi:hypothetical protein